MENVVLCPELFKESFEVTENFIENYTMCILFVYLRNKCGPGQYRLILASNRDEVFGRPAKLAHFWKENRGILAGMDMTPGRAGGTWLGVSKTGRIGVLLNDARSTAGDKKGRGPLVAGFISSKEDPAEYMEKLLMASDEYSPFQLIAVDMKETNTAIRHLSNIDGKLTNFDEGCYGFSNGSLAEPYKKANGGRVLLEEIVQRYGNSKENHDDLVQSLLGLLKNTDPYQPDETIEKFSTLPKSVQPAISAINVQLPEEYNYGTRAHTVILVDNDGNVDFYEWAKSDNAESNAHFCFKIE